jgi:hypothetical protein
MIIILFGRLHFASLCRKESFLSVNEKEVRIMIKKVGV